MAFVVPCVAIVVCYARIFYIVRKTAMRSHEPVHAQKSLTASMIIPMQRSIRQPRNNNGPAATAATATATSTAAPADAGHPTNAVCTTVASANTGSDVDRPPSQPKRRRTFESDSNSTEHSSEHSSSTTTTCHTHPYPVQPAAAGRVPLRFIDSSVDSEMPPQHQHQPLTASTVSIGKSVEFRSDVSGGGDSGGGATVSVLVEDGGVDGEDEHEGSAASSADVSGRRATSVRRKRFRQNGQKEPEVDSAVEESTSSSENNQVGVGWWVGAPSGVRSSVRD